MTIPAIWPGIDLDSIVFSDEEQRPGCEYRQCRAEALYEAAYRCANEVLCPHNRVLYCLGHKDQIMAQHAGLGLFHCPQCPGSQKALIRMEPLR